MDQDKTAAIGVERFFNELGLKVYQIQKQLSDMRKIEEPFEAESLKVCQQMIQYFTNYVCILLTNAFCLQASKEQQYVSLLQTQRSRLQLLIASEMKFFKHQSKSLVDLSYLN